MWKSKNSRVNALRNLSCCSLGWNRLKNTRRAIHLGERDSEPGAFYPVNQSNPGRGKRREDPEASTWGWSLQGRSRSKEVRAFRWEPSAETYLVKLKELGDGNGPEAESDTNHKAFPRSWAGPFPPAVAVLCLDECGRSGFAHRTVGAPECEWSRCSWWGRAGNPTAAFYLDYGFKNCGRPWSLRHVAAEDSFHLLSRVNLGTNDTYNQDDSTQQGYRLGTKVRWRACQTRKS